MTRIDSSNSANTASKLSGEEETKASKAEVGTAQSERSEEGQKSVGDHPEDSKLLAGLTLANFAGLAPETMLEAAEDHVVSKSVLGPPV